MTSCSNSGVVDPVRLLPERADHALEDVIEAAQACEADGPVLSSPGFAVRDRQGLGKHPAEWDFDARGRLPALLFSFCPVRIVLPADAS